jgi:hypothetical protein
MWYALQVYELADHCNGVQLFYLRHSVCLSTCLTINRPISPALPASLSL